MCLVFVNPNLGRQAVTFIRLLDNCGDTPHRALYLATHEYRPHTSFEANSRIFWRSFMRAHNIWITADGVYNRIKNKNESTGNHMSIEKYDWWLIRGFPYLLTLWRTDRPNDRNGIIELLYICVATRNLSLKTKSIDYKFFNFAFHLHLHLQLT